MDKSLADISLRQTEPSEAECAAAAEVWPSGKGVKRLNLALQGGGAHGAFTWGVLDRLLEDDRIAIDSVSGTSAGAVNGVALAYGLAAGGRERAREVLSSVWKQVSLLSVLSPLQPSPLDRMMGLGNMDFAPGYRLLDMMSRLWSPYEFNAFDINPLRSVLSAEVDFEVVRNCSAMKLFVSATNVRRGRIKIFEMEEMSLDAILASACLPFLSRAVEIEGEAYWDGGFMGNPAIYPLIYNSPTPDVMLVQINPINIEDTPTSAQAIIDRLNTITFNAGLMREMRAIHFVSELVDKGFNDEGRLRRMYMHVVHAEDIMQELGASSKLNADWHFLHRLFELGRKRTEAWLEAHFKDLGKRDTVDIEEMYL
ncbi:patatin-like phospholipase family protein [Limibacillus halophilus]